MSANVSLPIRTCIWLLAACLLFAGCSDVPRGVIVNDGQALANTAENYRTSTCRSIAKQLNDQLGGHWLSEVSILELPNFDPDQGAWFWQAATVQVNTIGDGSVPCPHSPDDIKLAVTKRLSPSVQQSRTNLKVLAAEIVDSKRFVALSAPPAPTSALAAEPSSASASAAVPRSYAVQTGDTLAGISSVFYGSSKYWRKIIEANPGLDPDNLKAGTVLVIPPIKEIAR